MTFIIINYYNNVTDNIVVEDGINREIKSMEYIQQETSIRNRYSYFTENTFHFGKYSLRYVNHITYQI